MKDLAKIVYRETREANKEGVAICSLHARAIVIRVPDLLLYERDRCHLVVELSGRWSMTSGGKDVVLDEEGNPLSSAHEETFLLKAESVLSAPRLAVEKAVRWFAEGAAFLEQKARESHSAGHTVHMEWR